ncbi:hypothetical protein ACODYM_11005 [Burkholderia gladioli]|uniref:hypothetical protein n=1 Tax=Burkholderia gladioli TaxID=28095 RepID=UPI0016423324|nr:hypothetical protein [Burkholderia gladioli]
MSTPQTGRRQFDMTVNVQSLLVSVGGLAVGAAVAWFSLVGRVQALEDHVKALEGALAQQRSDVKDSLRDLAGAVEKTNGKIDALTQQLYLNQAGSRPETKRWSR